MAYYAPYFDFFDAINNEVDNFNRALGNYPHNSYNLRQQLPSNSTELPRWFGRDDNGFLSYRSSGVTPAVDILEHDKSYEIRVTVPGIKEKKDINVEYHKDRNEIVISGEVPSSVTKENKGKVKVQEVASGSFRRVISLPEHPGIDADKIKADYSAGILALDVPKRESSPADKSVRKIEISDNK
ncbi:related to Heat shock protein 26 [Zygosaccharomyces bailii]|uniref:ZYBA0S05-03774g1_1 n=1 Tax=Zygosaccharomyces bailii (strain CLIB 213 / ATCC 58445 / CBS 680 / BCRC 21525 / NBRC 1098 / NCYC 1416 / NRRL Y-2227) TaxID=1333698 RepID=A0A8J2T6L7_ZYGB2|nr:ZYBA0S05-03774g1_1 [Zygosaccharomyces bailii CLIB 213]SJM87145.1 related to Heat shock protein 26 [Zygosaccharomyces bailii]